MFAEPSMQQGHAVDGEGFFHSASSVVKPPTENPPYSLDSIESGASPESMKAGLPSEPGSAALSGKFDSTMLQRYLESMQTLAEQKGHQNAARVTENNSCAWWGRGLTGEESSLQGMVFCHEQTTEIFLPESSQQATKQLILYSSKNEASYELTLRITRENVLEGVPAEAPADHPTVLPKHWGMKASRAWTTPTSEAAEEKQLSVAGDDAVSAAFITSDTFTAATQDNHVEVLIDGLETFKRTYEVLMAARHSICVLAWELNFSFGLVLGSEAQTASTQPLP